MQVITSPGPLPDASSLRNLLISSSVMVVISLQKSTFLPCSSSMYTCSQKHTTRSKSSLNLCENGRYFTFLFKYLNWQSNRVAQSLSSSHTLMSSSRSSMSVAVSPLRKVYGSCISTDRSSSSALMYFASRSMGFARPSRIRILDLHHITETRYKWFNHMYV